MIKKFQNIQNSIPIPSQRINRTKVFSDIQHLKNKISTFPEMHPFLKDGQQDNAVNQKRRKTSNQEPGNTTQVRAKAIPGLMKRQTPRSQCYTKSRVASKEMQQVRSIWVQISSKHETNTIINVHEYIERRYTTFSWCLAFINKNNIKTRHKKDKY